MSTLLAAVSYKTCFELVFGAVGEIFLLHEHEGTEDILFLNIGKVILSNIVPHFIIQHIFDFVHDGRYGASLVDLKRFLHADSRCGFHSDCLDRLVETKISYGATCVWNVVVQGKIDILFLRRLFGPIRFIHNILCCYRVYFIKMGS